MSELTEVEEFHVSGQPNPARGFEFPRYEFTWTDALARRHGYPSAREAALDFRNRIGATWTEVPTVTRRTVTYTAWEVVE